MKKYNIIPEKVGLINSVKSPFVDKEIEEYLAKGNGVYCRCAAPKKHKNPVRDLRTGFQNSGFEVKCSKVVPKRLLLLFYFPQKLEKTPDFFRNPVFFMILSKVKNTKNCFCLGAKIMLEIMAK